MTEWKPPNKNPPIPPGMQKMLDSLETLKAIIEGQIEADMAKADRLRQELKRVTKSNGES